MVFFKNKFQYEISGADSLGLPTPQNTANLINIVIEANEMLLEYDEESSIVATKFKEVGGNRKVICSMRLDLPLLLDDESDFDDMLADFYSKKPVDGKTKVPKLPTSRKVEKITPPPMSKELSNLINQTPQKDDFVEAAEKLSDPERNHEVEGIAEVVNQEPENSVDSEEMELLKQMILSQKREIDLLRKEMSNKEVAEVPTPEEVKVPVLNEFESSPEMDERESDSKTISDENTIPNPFESILETVSPEADNVSEVLNMLQDTINQTLANFISKESAKIDAEVNQADKRDLIAPYITGKLEDEKSTKLNVAVEKLAQEKAQAKATAEKEYFDKLSRIDNIFEERETKTLSNINQDYDKRIKSEIELETQKQTQTLAKLFADKKFDLKKRQDEMNNGLKKSIAKSLAGFNEKHNQVIAKIEDNSEPDEPDKQVIRALA